MLLLALSSLQGRPMQSAAEELLSLGPVGLQLTPGCAPTEGFHQWLSASKVSTRTHQGFGWSALRQPVWGCDGSLLARDHSVHPPRSDSCAAARFWEVATAEDCSMTFETMYPGYVLGTGAQLERAMALNLPLAVDTSHLFIQRCQGVITDATIYRLFTYDQVTEIHLSDNDGKGDQHRQLRAESFGIDWAIDRLMAGVPVVVESYVHKLSQDQRLEMLRPLLTASGSV
jgi:hypothetical protein